MKISTLHSNLTSLFAVLINVMAITFEVLRTCRDRVAMATIYVVMFGITVYEYPKFGKHMCMCKYNVQICKFMSIVHVILKHFRLCLRTSGTTLLFTLINVPQVLQFISPKNDILQKKSVGKFTKNRGPLVLYRPPEC